MEFSVANLIVWPRDESKSARILTFSESGINLVTGASRTGKSAIIKIIDYCLASKSCKIPKMGPIRRSAAWYGVVIKTEEGYKLLARKDPDHQESTGDYMVVESAVLSIPARPTKNANRAAVQALLNRLARLPQADSDFEESGSGYKNRASFGDLTSFIFQPQSVVANENVLFFEASDEVHARKLREIFPLVLGAIDADTLIRQHRLAEVRHLLERRRRQLEALQGTIEDLAGEIRGRYLTASDLRLLEGDTTAIDTAETNVLLTRLRDLVQAWVEGKRPQESQVAFGVADRLAKLRQRESNLAQRVASLRLRQVQLRELAQAQQVSQAILVRERDRLAPTSWLLDDLTHESVCPFCNSANATATVELDRLAQRTAAIENQWRGVAAIPAMLDAEEIEIRRARDIDEEELRQTRAEQASLAQLAESISKPEEERAVFIGKLLEFLSSQQAITEDHGLLESIRELEMEDSELSVQVDSELISQRKEDALLLISRYAQYYGRIVELENNDSIIKLDTRQLTVRVLNDRGESAWLNQIGSGANHLGYHVAIMLALHEFFISRPISYVPSLLILDQPSQTQFPDDIDEEAEQEEMKAVHKAFEAIDAAIIRTRNRLQVIISEHAGQLVYEGIKNLTLVERWRRGRKLIPWHWDAEALTELEGQPAESAVEDLIESSVLAAIASAFKLSDREQILDLQIERARFKGLGIVFQFSFLRGLLKGISSSTSLNTAVTGSREIGHGRIEKDLSATITPGEISS